MKRRNRFIVGGAVILAALSYLIYAGMREAVVYFATPTELKAQDKPSKDRFLRMGGMVVVGSLQKDLATLTYRFEITDGHETLPVHFRGVPPDLFSEGKGAVVEGRFGDDGVFRATTIMAKHSEEYSPPTDGMPAHPRAFVPDKGEKGP
jgi:cytochrome c-type biogenesis protein CcmE